MSASKFVGRVASKTSATLIGDSAFYKCARAARSPGGSLQWRRAAAGVVMAIKRIVMPEYQS